MNQFERNAACCKNGSHSVQAGSLVVDDDDGGDEDDASYCQHLIQDKRCCPHQTSACERCISVLTFPNPSGPSKMVSTEYLSKTI